MSSILRGEGLATNKEQFSENKKPRYKRGF